MFRPCPCGSGESSWWLEDAAGIACCRVCTACESEKRKKYNPRIFQSGTRYSASGAEEDIWIDDN